MTLVVFTALAAEGGRVLMLAPYWKSQKQLFYGLADGLVSRGHEVVFFNGFKPSTPVKGVREVVPDELAKVFADEYFPNVFQLNREGLRKAAGINFDSFSLTVPKLLLRARSLIN